MRQRLCLSRLILLCVVFIVSAAWADTIMMKDGRRLKGIVVEDYRDRLVLSTVDGEMTIMKSGIDKLSYDSEEDNLLKLAEQAQDRRDYQKAFTYYGMAGRLNPSSRAAKDGMVFLQGYLFRKEEAQKELAVKRMEEYERYMKGQPAGADEESLISDRKRLYESTGIQLKQDGKMPVAEAVLKNSTAYEAGLRRGDRIIAIWGRLTGYMPLGEVISKILDKGMAEFKCTLERDIDVKCGSPSIFKSAEKRVGAGFKMVFDGLTAGYVTAGGPSDRAGLEPGDLITAIDGISTRYMPLKKASEFIKNLKPDIIKFTIQREITIWKE